MRRKLFRWTTLTLSLSLVPLLALTALALARFLLPEANIELLKFGAELDVIWSTRFVLFSFGLGGAAAALLVAVRD